MNRFEPLKDALLDTLWELEAIAEMEATPPAPAAPSDEELSIALTGDPDFHKEAPAEFAKMKPFYDPDKEPFTSEQWMTLKIFNGAKNADSRKYKPEEVEGLWVRKHSQQMNTPQMWAYIKKGYIWNGDQWYKRVSAEDGVTSDEARQYFQDFPWKEGVSLGFGCPLEYDEAWAE